MSTSLMHRLGMKNPILIAPMFLVSDPAMLAAAAEAGAMAAMPSLNYRTHEEFREALRQTRELTRGPIAVNLIVKWSGDRLMQDLQACADFKVNAIITSLGLPTEVIPVARAAGMLVFHDVINLKHAQKVDALGVDAIISVAYGAGGHAGHISPFVLHPYLKANVKAPIIASGAITTGQQVAAALALGADLVYMGTRFIASTQSPAEDSYKQMIVDSAPEDVEFTPEVSGTHANFLKPSLNAYREKLASGGHADSWKSCWSAGQGTGLVHDIKPIGDIVREVMAEYEQTRTTLPMFG